MTSEDDFQNWLDSNRHDWQTRLVFADWLEERGDPRAEGYRALGMLRRDPDRYSLGDQRSRYFWWSKTERPSYASALPDDWQALLPPAVHSGFAPEEQSRRYVEDEAALAFAKLPAQRRAELIAGAADALPKPAQKAKKKKK